MEKSEKQGSSLDRSCNYLLREILRLYSLRKALPHFLWFQKTNDEVVPGLKN